MKALLLLGTLFLSQFALANNQLVNELPVVKGIVRKIDLQASRISIKHEEIPNLNMPPMTMSFLATDPEMLADLNIGDQILFSADELDGENVVVWLEKVKEFEVSTSNIFCTGTANTYPKTTIELEFRSNKFSTIRYEFAEGSLKGTAYVNSLGRMNLYQKEDSFIYLTGTRSLDSKLLFKVNGDQITQAHFTNSRAGLENAPVNCIFQ